jgi:hypothetical protein
MRSPSGSIAWTEQRNRSTNGVLPLDSPVASDGDNTMCYSNWQRH